MASEAEHPFIYLWAPCMSSLEKCLFKTFAHFYLGCLPLWRESCEFFIYFGDETLVWGIIGKYVFPYSWFSFYFNAVFFSHTNLFNLMRSSLFILSVMSLTLGDILVKILLCRMCEIFLPIFSSRTFMVSRLYISLFPTLNFLCVWCKLVMECRDQHRVGIPESGQWEMKRDTTQIV